MALITQGTRRTSGVKRALFGLAGLVYVTAITPVQRWFYEYKACVYVLLMRLREAMPLLRPIHAPLRLFALRSRMNSAYTGMCPAKICCRSGQQCGAYLLGEFGQQRCIGLAVLRLIL
jgi:hypothetical protein